MDALKIQDCLFPSGAKLRFLFAQSDLEFHDDELESLGAYRIEGPLRAKLTEQSPLFREHRLSRYLLLRLLADFKKRGVGSVAISISHTRGAAIVAGAASLFCEGAALACGVGVDLEQGARIISEGVHAKLLKSSEEKNFSPLDLWCLKEAAFKAHPQNTGLVLSDFVVADAVKQILICEKTKLKFEGSLQGAGFRIAFARRL